MVKSRRFFIPGGISLLFFIAAVLFPRLGFAQEAVVIPGIVEVQENHLYMVPIGTDDGVKKGDTIEIVRNDQKIADARLISVLVDNSMAEIVVLFVRTDILESDSVKFTKKIESRRSAPRKTLSTEERTAPEETALSVAAARAEDEKRRGLLGSDMHRYEEVVKIEGPLIQEIEQLKAGLALVKDGYEEKMDTVLGAVARSSSRNEALEAEKRWREKLLSTERRYQAQYNERKRLLERETARLEGQVAQLTNELKGVHDGTDKRVVQLLADLKKREEELSSLKKQFVEEHLAGEKQWKTKLENLEAQYQNQLRIQEENLKKSASTDKAKLQDDINSLAGQLESLKANSTNQAKDLQIRLKEREDLIDALRKEQISLESDLSRERDRTGKLESDIVTLKDVIAAAKRVHEKELTLSQQALEKKIEDMSVDFISTKHDYERELNTLRKNAQEDLLKNESQWVDKLAAVEKKYQGELNELNAASAAQINQLRAELKGQVDVIDLLKQNQTELTAKLQASEQQFKNTQSDLSALENQLAVEKATRSENINLAKKPLEDKVAELSAQIVASAKDHEAKTGEDATLIEFLNGAMVDLTNDLEAREGQLGKLQESFSLAQGEIEAMKRSHLERMELAKKPLEERIANLNTQIVSVRKNYEEQVATLQENASRDLLTSEEKWQKQLQEKDQERQKGLDDVRQEMGEQIIALQRTIDEVNTEKEKAVQLSQEDTDKRIAAVQKEWEARLNDAELQYQKALNEETAKKQSVIDFLKQEKSDLVAQMASLQRESEIKIKEMEIVAQQGSAEVDQQWQAKLKEREEAISLLERDKVLLNTEISSLTESYEEKLVSQKNSLDGKITALSDQLGSLNQSSSNIISDLQGQLKSRQDEMSVLAKDSSALVSDLTKRKNELTAAEDTIAVLKQQIKETNAAHSNWTRSVKKPLDEEIKKLNNEIASLKKDHVNEINALKKDAGQNLTASEKQWQEKFSAQQDDYEKKLSAQAQDSEKKMTDLNGQLVRFKDNSEAALGDLKVQLEKGRQAVASLQEKNAELISGIGQKDSRLEKLEGDREQLARELREVRASYDDQIKIARQPLEERIKTLDRELESSREKTKEELKKVEEQWQARLNEIEKLRAKDIKEAKNPLEDKIAALTKELGSLSGAAKAELAATEREWKEKVKEKEREISHIKKNSEVEWKDKFAKSEKEWAEKFTLAEKKYQEQSKRQEEELQAKISTLNQDLDSLKKDSGGVIAQLQADLKAKQNSIGAFEREKSGMRADLDKKDAELAKAKEESDRLKGDLKGVDSLRGNLERSSEEIARLKDQMQELKGNSTRQEEILRNELEIERRVVGDLEKKLAEKDASVDKRIDLAKESLEAEAQTLKAELASVRSDYEAKIKAAGQRAQEDQRIKEQQWQAKLAMNQTEWESKWKARETERQEGLAMMERKVFEGKKEMRETVIDLNNRFAMLKDVSDSQMRELEKGLEAKHYQLTLKESEIQERLDEAQKQWSKELAEVKKSHVGELEQQKRVLEEGFYNEKEQHNQTVTDLTRQFGELRDNTGNRIKDLEVVIEKKDYELSLLKDRSQKDFLGVEEKWQARLAAAEEKKQRESLEQKRDMQNQLLEKQKNSQLTIDGLNKQIDSMKDRFKSDILLKEEETAVQLALLEKKYQDQISAIKAGMPKNSVDQERLVEAELQWSKRMDEAQRKHQTALEQQKRVLEEDFLNEKKQLNQTVTDLTRQFGDLRDNTGNRVKDLEVVIEKKDYELSLLKDRSQKDFLGVEEKWQARLAAAEEKKQRELLEQKRDMQNQILTKQENSQLVIDDLNKQIDSMKNQFKSDILSKEEETAVQLALLEKKYQDQISAIKAGMPKNSVDQERLVEAELQWSKRMDEAQRKHQTALEQQKRSLTEGFLNEKGELRQTVVDLTRQFSELRDNTGNRIKDLESEIEKKDYKLSLLESQSEQNILGTEEKWQAKLAAIEERRQRELLEQKRDIQSQFLLDQEKLQATVSGLNRQIGTMRDQVKLDLALKDEEAAAERALLERRYQDQLYQLKVGASSEVTELTSAVRSQQETIDSLKSEKNELALNLDERERELAGYRASVNDLKKETRLIELTQSEKLRLSRQSLGAKIEELSTQLAIAKERAVQEREDLENRWKARLAKNEEEYLRKLKLQRQSMAEETAALDNKIGILSSNRIEELNEMKAELQDNQTLIRLLSKEKYALSDHLENKDREIVRLNEDIIRLKEGLDIYKDLLPVAGALKSRGHDGHRIVASGHSTEDRSRIKEDYYATVRTAILDKFKEFDFSNYEGRDGVVKIDFELFANGSPKDGPEFLGTEDEGLKDLLSRCFQDALPFPPFPENLGQESQRFSLGVSFQNK